MVIEAVMGKLKIIMFHFQAHIISFMASASMMSLNLNKMEKWKLDLEKYNKQPNPYVHVYLSLFNSVKLHQ